MSELFLGGREVVHCPLEEVGAVLHGVGVGVGVPAATNAQFVCQVWLPHVIHFRATHVGMCCTHAK